MRITVLLTEHRIEHLPIFEKYAREHELIILEEPYPDLVDQVLRGALALEKYVEIVYTEFSKFLIKQYEILKKLWHEGKIIYASEPYLAQLVKIYRIIELKQDIRSVLDRDKLLKYVHNVENVVSERLLEYYNAVANIDFEESVNALLKFAKADAYRILARDVMRAVHIKSLLDRKFSSEGIENVLIEAGVIHRILVKVLNIHFDNCVNVVNSKELLARQCLGLSIDIDKMHPGYLLTYIYLGIEEPPKDTDIELLAARCIVYNILITKSEQEPTEQEPCPHLLEEYRILRFVNKLDYEHCKKLFERTLVKLGKVSPVY